MFARRLERIQGMGRSTVFRRVLKDFRVASPIESDVLDAFPLADHDVQPVVIRRCVIEGVHTIRGCHEFRHGDSPTSHLPSTIPKREERRHPGQSTGGQRSRRARERRMSPGRVVFPPDASRRGRISRERGRGQRAHRRAPVGQDLGRVRGSEDQGATPRARSSRRSGRKRPRRRKGASTRTSARRSRRRSRPRWTR